MFSLNGTVLFQIQLYNFTFPLDNFISPPLLSLMNVSASKLASQSQLHPPPATGSSLSSTVCKN